MTHSLSPNNVITKPGLPVHVALQTVTPYTSHTRVLPLTDKHNYLTWQIITGSPKSTGAWMDPELGAGIVSFVLQHTIELLAWWHFVDAKLTCGVDTVNLVFIEINLLPAIEGDWDNDDEWRQTAYYHSTGDKIGQRGRHYTVKTSVYSKDFSLSLTRKKNKTYLIFFFKCCVPSIYANLIDFSFRNYLWECQTNRLIVDSLSHY